MRYRIAGAVAAAVLFTCSERTRGEEGQFDLSPRSMELLEEAVGKNGDPVRGREIFLDTRDAQCANCHRLQGAGGHIGPDLGSIIGKLSARDIAEALIAPSRKLTKGYETYTVARVDGKILSGLKIGDSPEEIRLRDGLGKDTVIRRAQIARMEKSPVSLMPARLVSRLSREDLVNLVSFLKNPGAQKHLSGRLSRAWITGPFNRVINKPEPLEKNPDPARVAVSAAGKILQWKLINTRSDGSFKPGGPFAAKKSSYYLLGWLKSGKEGEATLQIEHSAGIRLLVNSKTVYNSREAGKDIRLVVRLQRGWNTILSRVASPGGDSTFGIRIEPAAGLRLCADRQD